MPSLTGGGGRMFKKLHFHRTRSCFSAKNTLSCTLRPQIQVSAWIFISLSKGQKPVSTSCDAWAVMHLAKRQTCRQLGDQTVVQATAKKNKTGGKKLWCETATESCLSQWHVHLFGPCCTAGSSFLAAMFLQMEEIRRMTPGGLSPPAKVKHRLLPPPPAHFPPLWRGPWVIHTSPSLHSKPSSSGYKLSLLTLPCSTDTAWMGIKIYSQPYLAHLYIQNMCLGSVPLHRHLFNSESAPSTQRKNRSDHFRMFFSAD